MTTLTPLTGVFLLVSLLCFVCQPAWGESGPKQYFAHRTVEDHHGVIAPWYQGLNGQCDFRVRVAAETMKRYPWIGADVSVRPGPCYIFNGGCQITPKGEIHPHNIKDISADGDLGQRSAYVISGLVDYYRYTGDPAAIGPITITADYLIDYCQTPLDHPWPGFLISCPTKGKPFGRADPKGYIQLDYACQVGLSIAAAYKLTGNQRYLETVKHWADLMAEHCDLNPGADPWPRYANPECVKWKDNRMTGGVALVLLFLDDVIRLGHTGKDDIIIKARDAGEEYLQKKLLPNWTDDATWGCHFWDWPNPTNAHPIPGFAAGYMMAHPDRFPGWRCDARNILTLFFARASVSPESRGGVFSGAWSLPESSNCCELSQHYPSQLLASWLARYGKQADNPWASELARRMIIISTYDANENGVVKDSIAGGITWVARDWFNLCHPWPLKYTLDCISWLPESLGANRENHIVRSTSVVSSVVYGKGRIEYYSFAAPAPCIDVLRLAFAPNTVTADGEELEAKDELDSNGYTFRPLANGDCIVTLQHDGRRKIVVTGDDPQQMVGDEEIQYAGQWNVLDDANAYGKKLHATGIKGSEASFSFDGNQVRLIGCVDTDGGKADVYLDGVKQLVDIDCWCPERRNRQVLYYKNGLSQGKHTLKVVALGEQNPLSKGKNIYFDGIQWSSATGMSGFGSGGGSAEPQRVIFGYEQRTEYTDSQGHVWRPATELVMRIKKEADLIPLALWTEARAEKVIGTKDPELYRYGMYGPDFTAYFTVTPIGTYNVRIKLAELQKPERPGRYATTIQIQGKEVARDLDIAATAGGYGKAVDLVFNNVKPKNGVIAIRFHNPHGQLAMVQAIEVEPGKGEDCERVQ